MKRKIRDIIFYQELKINQLYIFPKWGFAMYDKEGKRLGFLSANPFTKSLAHEYFFSKYYDEKNDLVIGNFLEKPFPDDFGLDRESLLKRDWVGIFFVSVFYVPFVYIYRKIKKET